MINKDVLDKLGVTDERTDKYYRIENVVIEDFERFPTVYHLGVYNAIVKMGNRNKYCYPSYKTIGKFARCSPRKAMDVIADFVKTGVLKKVVRYDEESKTNKSNVYGLVDLTEQTEGKDTPMHDMHKGSAQHAQGVVHSMHKGSAQHAHKKELTEKELFEKEKQKNRDIVFSASDLKKDYLIKPQILLAMLEENITDFDKSFIVELATNYKLDQIQAVYEKAKANGDNVAKYMRTLLKNTPKTKVKNKTVQKQAEKVEVKEPVKPAKKSREALINDFLKENKVESVEELPKLLKSILDTMLNNSFKNEKSGEGDYDREFVEHLKKA